MRIVTLAASTLYAAGALLVGLIGPTTAQSIRIPSLQEVAPATNCDTYAASDLDPQRKAQGIPFDKINPVLAIPACERAVQKYPNSVRLIYQLGRAYGKNNNFKSAFVQYQKAADQGFVLAEYNMGVLYEKGLGVAKDETKAVTWYRLAAEQGFVLAQYNLGNMYRNGQGVVQDYAEALKWMRKAAAQGNASAMANIGVMYANAQGVPQDYAAAVSWWLKAAEQREVISQTHLGSAYYLGQGVAQNRGEAAKWFQLAADQGYANAQYLLGLLYEHGDGVPKNIAEATDWYRKAAAQGNEEAQKKVATLDTDAKAGRAAEAAGNDALQKALAARKTTTEAWEEAALAAGRAALNAELAAGATHEAAKQAAQQATEQVRARAPKMDAGESGTITVEMSVAATPTNPPVIMGRTNLPDGTILSVYLLGDPPACVPQCGLEYNPATVQNGRFTTTLRGPLGALISDSYRIEVAFFGPQSQNVQSVIGKLGERLRGRYVVTLGPHGQYVPVEFPRDNPSDSEKMFGYMIHYTQKIFVAGNASSDAASRTQAVADFRNWTVKSCTSNIDFVNALVRSGSVSGSETLGAERQAKIDACVAQAAAQLQTALKSRARPNSEPDHPYANNDGSIPATSQQVTCAATGPSPNPVDPTLAPRIIAWVTALEEKLGLTAANWHGQPARASNPAVAAALELQALTADWEAAARPGTVEGIFRSAVGHGVNVQYETLMINADPANAKTHQFWVDTEAARAAACLSLIQMPLSP